MDEAEWEAIRSIIDEEGWLREYFKHRLAQPKQPTKKGLARLKEWENSTLRSLKPFDSDGRHAFRLNLEDE